MSMINLIEWYLTCINFDRRSKYELQDFLKPGLRIASGKGNQESNSSNKFLDSFRSSSSKKTVKTVIITHYSLVLLIIYL